MDIASLVDDIHGFDGFALPGSPSNMSVERCCGMPALPPSVAVDPERDALALASLPGDDLRSRPQFGQCSKSISKTRLSGRAKLIN